MITAPIRLDFTSPERMHASGDDITTVAMARKLEEEYSVIRGFVLLHKQEIQRIFAKEMAIAIKRDKSNDEMDGAISLAIMDVWRAYILNEEHGIKTKASEARGDPSFVDTSDYYLSMTPRVIHE